MNKTLLENNYLVIPNFIDITRSKNLSKEFVEYSKTNSTLVDSQVPNSYSAYNYISFLELLCEKTHKISEAIGETVLPTYSYARIYKNQCTLSPHVDRESCEISLTLHLDGDQPWHIWIETPKGEQKGVLLNPGDAMIYLGRIASHWRHPYQGEYYTQVFLHYVRSRGDCFNFYFDKNNNLETLGLGNSKILDNFEQEISDSTPTTTKNLIENIEPTDIEVESNELKITSASKLEDFIVTFDDIVPIDLCDKIIFEYENSSDWNKTSVGGNNYNPEIRSCETINISAEDIINKNIDIRKSIDEALFKCAHECLLKYKNMFPHVVADSDTGYELLRYETGQHYSQHTDSFRLQQRSVSCSLLLNDDYEGGEFAFFDREILIKGAKGSAIMFPSNFMYPHEILKVISGTRYSIITWYV
jgi:hypothetical protein